jgi:hypothetical protein
LFLGDSVAFAIAAASICHRAALAFTASVIFIKLLNYLNYLNDLNGCDGFCGSLGQVLTSKARLATAGRLRTAVALELSI